MLRIGITGQNGFIGTHLFNTLGLYPEKYQRIPFKKEFFNVEKDLDKFVSQCDTIVHLAAMNRHDSQELIYETNISLVTRLVDSLKRTASNAHLLFASSSQEERDNLYGKSKKDGRKLLAKWVEKSGGIFTGMVIPNVFGPFGLPDYNSFISTFCYRLTHGKIPEIKTDSEIFLIYIGELVSEILHKIDSRENEIYYGVPCTKVATVSDILNKLQSYKQSYLDKGDIPVLDSVFDRDLFNTFRSYIDHKNYFPVKFMQHTDSRGMFVEIIRSGTGGQVSFSTTGPGITRGNHYHTRKIERFAVIKGKALIQLRRIGTNEVLNFELDGDTAPAYVDMPIWYTHSIKNIGNKVVYTNFWINEPYDPEDPDTFPEEVQ
ncbi:MAG: SDR family oxidoreductase [Chitinophagaceae bacterium]|nr:MAG: SDR family oxidoreductase [Chitinophagaceae bacterium]